MTKKTLNNIKAEVMEMHEKYASNAKANGGLVTGIIGTSLAGILAMKTGLFNGIFGGGPCQPECGIPHGELYNERKEQEDYVALTKQFYEGVIAAQADSNKKFFDLYKLNVDTSKVFFTIPIGTFLISVILCSISSNLT